MFLYFFFVNFSDQLRQLEKKENVNVGKKATRQSFGENLSRLGEIHKEIVVLDADLSKSTKSEMFAKKFPERFFEMGIAEANMIGTSAGLAFSDKIVYICSFAVFVTGRYDIIRMSIAYPKANVRIVGTHSGVGVGEDGNSQQALEDISIMRSLPNMAVVQPADDIETAKLMEYSVKHDGPMFIRLTRQGVEDVNSKDNYQFEFGKGVVLKDGKDFTMIATGGTVFHTLKAAEKLENNGISTRVVNIHTIKPIDRELIIKCAKETKGLFTVEDHNIIGGLGSAVCEVVAEEHPAKIYRHGLPDVFGLSGSPDELYTHFKIDTDGIYEVSKRFYDSL